MPYWFFPNIRRMGPAIELNLYPKQKSRMCVTKLETEPVTNEFICSDPVFVFLFPMCCFVLTLARTTYFVKWSKLQGRASLESGSFLYHIKHSASMPQVYITAAQRKLRHCRGCGREETKNNTAVMVKKKTNKFFFSLKNDCDLSQT